MRKFWNDVNDCLRKCGRGRRVTLFEAMNGRTGSSELGGMVGK